MQVLGLDAGTLAGPALDLGCGAQAALVREWAGQGIDAHGVDLAVEGPHTTRADWLTFPLVKGYYALVVSHLGFALHFIYHHLRPGPEAYLYAARYRELLEALAPGGRFVYVPGLPFIEAALPPERFEVARVALPEALRGGLVAALGAQVGADVAYAAHVTRRGAGGSTGDRTIPAIAGEPAGD